MIQVGTRVQWSDSKLTGTVSAIHAKEFDVIWDNSEGHTSRGLLYSFLVQRFADRPYVQIIPSDTITTPPSTDTLTERSMAMSHNIGLMEATIEILYEALSRVADAMDADGKPGVYREIDRMKASIVRCANGMRDLPKANGGSTISDLKLFILSNK